MKYVVIRTADRDTVVIGKAATQKEANEIMRNDFVRWFCESYGEANEDTFEEVYEKYADCDEYELLENNAWINDCNHSDFDWSIIDTESEDILEGPLTEEQMKEMITEDNPYLSGNIIVDQNEMIDNDLEGFLDLISERLTGSPLLMDIDYKPIDVLEDGRIIFRARGDVSSILDLEENEE